MLLGKSPHWISIINDKNNKNDIFVSHCILYIFTGKHSPPKSIKKCFFTTATTTRPIYFLTVSSLRLTNVKARISPTSPELGLVGTYRASSSSLLTAYKVNETGKLLTDSFKVSAIF